MAWRTSTVQNLTANETMREMEDIVRQLTCRTCLVPPGQGCTYPVWMNQGRNYSHILRYQDAADNRLVPYIRNGYRVSVSDRP